MSCYFGTKFTTVVQVQQILQWFGGQKIDQILNREQVFFIVARVMYVNECHFFNKYCNNAVPRT